MVVVLIGPMGCGKTTIGRLLAARLGWVFSDADDFHPAENVSKMRAGIPLDDRDRQGWLTSLRDLIEQRQDVSENLVLACSALKKSYRDILGIDQHQVVSVYLRGDSGLLQKRLEGREHQYMNKGLLASQLQTLEEPADGLRVDIDQGAEVIVEEIVRWLESIRGGRE